MRIYFSQISFYKTSINPINAAMISNTQATIPPEKITSNIPSTNRNNQ